MEKGKETRTVKRILRYIIPYKVELMVVLFCLMVAAVMTFLQPLFIRQITDKGMMDRNMTCILKYAGFLLLTGLLSQIMELIQNNYFVRIHNQFALVLNKASFEKMYRLPISYYSEIGGMETVNTVGTDVGNILSVTESVSAFSISSVLQIIGGIIGLSILDWRLTLFIVILIPLKGLITILFSKRKSKLFDIFLEENRKYYSWIDDQIGGIREMKLWNLFTTQLENFNNMQKGMMDSYKDNSVWDQKKLFCENMLDTIVKCLLYALSGFLIVKGQMTIGSAFAFISYSGYVTIPVSSLINIGYLFAKVTPSAIRFFNFLDLPEEQYLEAGNEEKSYNTDVVVEFDQVSFAYESEAPVLEGVCLKVHKGEKVGIIGNNGSGKSTVLDMILGLYQPCAGTVKIGGRPLPELGLENVRSRIAVVSQKPYLFNSSVEENVNLVGDASPEEIREVCRISGADTFIRGLEAGYQQQLGRDGAKLSGGEKQKIAVARALLRETEILLLDEATSGYDVNSNQSLNALLRKEFKDKTIILVTHKYEELEIADNIYEIKNGKIREVLENIVN